VTTVRTQTQLGGNGGAARIHAPTGRVGHVAAAPDYPQLPTYPPDSTVRESDPTDATRGYPPDSTDDSNSLKQIAF
jgi:hypothetical protein